MRFRIEFFKTVYDPLGHPHRALQYAVVLKSDDPHMALQDAQTRMCVSHGTEDWRLHADDVSIEQLLPHPASRSCRDSRRVRTTTPGTMLRRQPR